MVSRAEAPHRTLAPNGAIRHGRTPAYPNPNPNQGANLSTAIMGAEFLVSETVDPYLFTTLAAGAGLWLFNKLLSTNPKMVAEGKPYGVLDADGLLWAAPNVKNLKTTPLPGVTTVYDLVQHGVKTNGPRDALGKRPLLERHYEDLNGKQVEKLTYANHYEWMSYSQFGSAISSLGAGLVGLGGLKVLSTQRIA